MNTAHHHGGHQSTGRKWNRGQVVKWTIYALLLVNFFYYFFEEMYIASHTLSQGGALLDWTEELATTIDELGWFGLLFMFELETYALSDESLEKRKVRWSIHGVRLVCYLLLAHTVMARYTTVRDYEAVQQAQNITSLCQVAGQDVYFGENYRYELVSSENCAELSGDSTFYFTDPAVIMDRDAYQLERKLVWL
ncbi:MAG: hypothetical protein KJO85_06935, partial [Gammaproteobacteria bacterium]|nr:hypothetical protein [Gammaproteobacteria bacterium]